MLRKERYSKSRTIGFDSLEEPALKDDVIIGASLKPEVGQPYRNQVLGVAVLLSSVE